MKKPKTIPHPRLAILALVDIKAAVTAFDHGECNVGEALDAIAGAIATYRNQVARPSQPAQRCRWAA